MQVHRDISKYNKDEVLEQIMMMVDARKSLLKFTEYAWPVMVGPNKPFENNWHMGCMAEHLEACKLGQIKNIIFNLPPRHGKSSIISVTLCPWWWLDEAWRQFYYASYDLRLAERDSINTHRLLESEWYKKYFGHLFQLITRNVTKLENDKRGYRACTSSRAGSTGHGGDIRICFPYHVEVMTDIGLFPIGKIVSQRIECRILSYNHKKEALEYNNIVNYDTNKCNKLVEIEFDGGLIECTEDHPIYTRNGYGNYKAAGCINENDILFVPHPNFSIAVAVKSVKVKIVDECNVYNLEVENNHNYIANGILVHNCDDPNLVSIKKNQVETDAKREAVNEWYSGAWATRSNDPRKDINIISQQRTHEKDLTGYLLALMMEDITNSEWIHVCLPARFEKSRQCKTIILPSTNGKIWEDPRKEDGDLLWPERWGEKELKRLEKGLGTQYRIAGQLQQRPAPADGGLLKRGHFKIWKHENPPVFDHIIQSWDPALSAKDYENNSYHACTTWGIFKDDNKFPAVMHLGTWRGRGTYDVLRDRAKRLFLDYRDSGEERFIPPKKDKEKEKWKGKYDNIQRMGLEARPEEITHTPDIVIIEEKALGYNLVNDMRKAGISVIGFNPTEYGDKIERVQKITHLLEAGLVWVPAAPPHYDRLREFSDILVNLCSVFPNSESRDVVDTMTQALLWLTRGGRIFHPDDKEWFEKKPKKERNFYGED